MTVSLDGWLAALVAGLVDADGPGAAVGVYRDGALTAAATRGLGCLEYAVPISTRTRFDLASVSKQMTAACALLLHRDGVVDPDADLRTWLPELRLPGVTLRGCLQHTTGLPDYEEIGRLRGDALADLADLPRFLAWLSTADDPNFAPGTDLSYSNTGYVAVAAALSRATGRPFGALMRERVFEPLGMADTLVRDTIGLVVSGMAFSYRHSEAAGYLRLEMPEEQVGDGAVLSHLEDLAGWHGFLFDGRGLGADILGRLVEPAVLADGRPTRYGCGVGRHRVDGHDVFAHSGGMHGYTCYLVSAPGQGLGVTVLANRSLTDVRALAVDVLRHSLGHPADRSGGAPAPSPPEDRTWFCPATGEAVSSAAQAAGRLELMTSGGPVTLTWDGAGAWRSPDCLLEVEPAFAGILRVRDELGRIMDFLPAEVPHGPADTSALPGWYHSAGLGPVKITRAGGTLLVELGRRPVALLEPVASFRGDDIYRTSEPPTVWLRRHRDDGTLSLSTGSSVFRLRPRSGGPTATSAGVTRSGTGPEAPPSPR